MQTKSHLRRRILPQSSVLVLLMCSGLVGANPPEPARYHIRRLQVSDAPLVNSVSVPDAVAAAEMVRSRLQLELAPAASITDANAAGQIVGWQLGASGRTRAYRWDDVSGAVDLADNLNALESRATAIGADGTVVGTVLERNASERAFLWRPGSGAMRMPTLGSGASGALDVNGQDQAVGRAQRFPGGEWTAVLWQYGHAYDLNALVTDGDALREGVSLHSATSIDDTGRILAYGTDLRTGATNLRFELNPVPTAAPPAPMIDSAAGDDCINGRETTIDGVNVVGRSLPGAQVTVMLAASTRQVLANGSGQWSAGFGPGDLTPLADGNVQVTAVQRDSLGQDSPIARRTALKDTIAPTDPTTVPDLEPGSDSGLSNFDNLTRFTDLWFEGFTARGLWFVELHVNGALRSTGEVNEFGKWRTRLGGAQPPGVAVAARSMDRCRNPGPLSDALPVAIDVNGPALSVAILAGDRLLGGPEVVTGLAITGTATVGDTVSVVLQQGATGYSRQAVSGGAWSLDFMPAELATFSEGKIDVKVQAIDRAGNYTTKAGGMTKDTVVAPPVIAMVAGDDVISTAEAKGVVEIRGTAEAGARITMSVGNVLRAAPVNGSGVWSASLGSRVVIALPTGPLEIRASAVDKAGNQSAVATRAIVKQ